MTSEYLGIACQESLRRCTITAAAAKLLDSELCSAEGRKPEGPRPHVDIGSPIQCKVSISGQMKHVKLGLAKH